MKKGAKHKISCLKTSKVRNRPEVGLSVRGCRQEYFTLVRCELTDSQFYSVICFGIAGHFQWVGSLLAQNRDLRRLFCWFPGAKAPNRTHLTVSMFFYISWTVWYEVEGPWRSQHLLKSSSRVWDWDEGVTVEETKELIFSPKKGHWFALKAN